MVCILKTADAQPACTRSKILKSLLHENIVSYISHEVLPDPASGARALRIYMEYCAGGTLERIIDRAARRRELVPEIRVWQYLAQMLEALKYCHSPRTDREPVIHRDLKPSNGMCPVACSLGSARAA